MTGIRVGRSDGLTTDDELLRLAGFHAMTDLPDPLSLRRVFEMGMLTEAADRPDWESLILQFHSKRDRKPIHMLAGQFVSVETRTVASGQDVTIIVAGDREIQVAETESEVLRILTRR